MSMQDNNSGFFSDKGWTVMLYYAIPIVVASVLSFLLVTWAFMLFGGSVWSVAVAASVLGAFFSIFMEEVVHDVE